MFEYSEEDPKFKGLGWIKGKVLKFKRRKKFTVPHVGWNRILFNNMKLILLQTPINSDTISDIIVQEKTLSIIDLISSGGIGGNIIMGALGLLSIYAIYILIERYSTIKKASVENENFLKSIRNFV